MASNPNNGGFGPSTTPVGPGPLGSTNDVDLGLNPNPVSNTAAGMGGMGGGSMGSADTLGGMGSTSGMTDRAAGDARSAVEGVRDQAMKLKDQALDQARSAAVEGKEKAAETLSGVAQNVRDAARSLGQNETIAPVGRYANQAADAIEDFAGTLRDRDVDQLFNDISGFVRRNPAVAVGVAVAAGFAVSRLLKGGDSRGGSVYGGSRYAGGYDDDNAFKS